MKIIYLIALILKLNAFYIEESGKELFIQLKTTDGQEEYTDTRTIPFVQTYQEIPDVILSIHELSWLDNTVDFNITLGEVTTKDFTIIAIVGT